MRIDRRMFSGGMLCALAAGWAGSRAARAGDYPTRPVNLVIPVGPGGGPDVIARLVADRLARTWHQQIVALNRPGAGGLIALQAAAKLAPDGYSLYMPLSSTIACCRRRTHSCRSISRATWSRSEFSASSRWSSRSIQNWRSGASAS